MCTDHRVFDPLHRVITGCRHRTFGTFGWIRHLLVGMCGELCARPPYRTVSARTAERRDCRNLRSRNYNTATISSHSLNLKWKAKLKDVEKCRLLAEEVYKTFRAAWPPSRQIVCGGTHTAYDSTQTGGTHARFVRMDSPIRIRIKSIWDSIFFFICAGGRSMDRWERSRWNVSASQRVCATDAHTTDH